MQIAVNKISWRTIALDVTLIAAACFIPALSHLTALPLYHADPMRWLLLTGVLLAVDKHNGYVLAVALPVMACLLSGVPSPAKALIIALELSVNVALLQWLKGKMHILPAVLISIAGAKMVYYGVKFLILSPAVLVTTAWTTQLIVAAAMCVTYTIGYRLLKRK